MRNLKFAIIVPFYNHWSLTHKLLTMIISNVFGSCDIVLVNDGSEEEVDDKVEWWIRNSRHHTIAYYKKEKNSGFGDSMNIGASYAIEKFSPDYIILLSNDVIVGEDFTRRFYSLDRTGKRYLIGGEIINYPAGWNEFTYNGNNFFIPYANGWFLAIKARDWLEIGGFDARYNKFDYEDVDLSVTALLNGLELRAFDDISLYHIGSQTISRINLDRLEHTKLNRQIFIEKWESRFGEIMEILRGKT